MGMADSAPRWTAQMVRELPDDGNRYEVVHGELLVTPAPAPRHQDLVVQLTLLLAPYLKATGGRGRLWTAPCDISWDDATLVQPDLLVVPAGEVSNDWGTFKTLWLAIEILSPSSARADRVVKRRLYQENRVGAYWIVDSEAHVVEVWQWDDERPAIVTDTLRWRVTPDAPELGIDLASLFRGLPE